MRESLPDAFIYVKRVKFQVEFPGNQIQFPGSQNPLDRIFYTYDLNNWPSLFFSDNISSHLVELSRTL